VGPVRLDIYMRRGDMLMVEVEQMVPEDIMAAMRSPEAILMVRKLAEGGPPLFLRMSEVAAIEVFGKMKDLRLAKE
jgi:hypothetical protein